LFKVAKCCHQGWAGPSSTVDSRLNTMVYYLPSNSRTWRGLSKLEIEKLILHWGRVFLKRGRTRLGSAQPWFLSGGTLDRAELPLVLHNRIRNQACGPVLCLNRVANEGRISHMRPIFLGRFGFRRQLLAMSSQLSQAAGIRRVAYLGM
jgi:hypothetical protein